MAHKASENVMTGMNTEQHTVERSQRRIERVLRLRTQNAYTGVYGLSSAANKSRGSHAKDSKNS